jgi:BirA family biotin operon repressor/biotin-[acetyl-CoA-carboxylase] ligase
MLPHVAAAMQHWLDVWALGTGFAQVRRAWLERAGPIGEACSIDTGAEKVLGTFLDLDADGALTLRDQHGLLRRLTVGDVTLTSPAPTERR